MSKLQFLNLFAPSFPSGQSQCVKRNQAPAVKEISSSSSQVNICYYRQDAIKLHGISFVLELVSKFPAINSFPLSFPSGKSQCVKYNEAPAVKIISSSLSQVKIFYARQQRHKLLRPDIFLTRIRYDG